MILSLWNYLAGTILLLIAKAFPISDGFPDDYVVAFAEAGKVFYIVEPVSPNEVLIGCVAFLIGFELTILTFKFFIWAFSFIPFFGGKGLT